MPAFCASASGCRRTSVPPRARDFPIHPLQKQDRLGLAGNEVQQSAQPAAGTGVVRRRKAGLGIRQAAADQLFLLGFHLSLLRRRQQLAGLRILRRQAAHYQCVFYRAGEILTVKTVLRCLQAAGDSTLLLQPRLILLVAEPASGNDRYQ